MSNEQRTINDKVFEVILGGGSSMHGNSFNRRTFKIDGKRVSIAVYNAQMIQAYKDAGIENPRTPVVKRMIEDTKTRLSSTASWNTSAVKYLKATLADYEAELTNLLA